jgi:hypothetical protein
VDCGSGTGKLTRMVARAIPASHVVGLELSKWPYREACFLKRLFQLHNLEYQQKDIFAHDYTTTNAVIIFLNARVTEAIGKKFYAELRPNALVIANEFELKGSWPAPQVITIYTPFRGTLYVYRR